MSLEVMRRCDDRSEENIANVSVAEKAVLKGVSSLEFISKMRVQVTLKKERESAEYSFSRVPAVASTALHLSVGQLAQNNMMLLVAEIMVESEDLLIGLPFICQLQVETKKLLEENIFALNGTDCSLKETQQKERGHLRRVIDVRLNRQVSKVIAILSAVDVNQPRVSYHDAR